MEIFCNTTPKKKEDKSATSCFSGWFMPILSCIVDQTTFKMTLKSLTLLKKQICGLIRVLTFMVRSPEAETMYLSSKSTTLTAARWPTRTRRRLMSVGEAMSHTAIERSFEQVTISPLQNRRWSTASLWWISVFRTSPELTSHTLHKRNRETSQTGIHQKEGLGIWTSEQRTYRARVCDRNLTWQWNQRNR